MSLFELVKLKSVEVGDCWEWTGRRNATIPLICVQRRNHSIRRLLAGELGMHIQNTCVIPGCGTVMCVRPEHFKVVTRSAMRKLYVQTHGVSHSIAHRKKIADSVRRNQSKLTPEKVEQIRQASGPQARIAKEFGVVQSTVSLIRSRKTWRDYADPFAGIIGALTR